MIVRVLQSMLPRYPGKFLRAGGMLASHRSVASVSNELADLSALPYPFAEDIQEERQR